MLFKLFIQNDLLATKEKKGKEINYVLFTNRVIFWLKQGAGPQQSECRSFILQPFKGLPEPPAPAQLIGAAWTSFAAYFA